MATVKCYRALVALKISENDIRQFGDLVPEAADWPNTDTYVRASQLEVVWVDEAEVKKFLASVSSPTAKKTTAKKVATKKIVRKAPVKEKSDGIIEEVV